MDGGREGGGKNKEKYTEVEITAGPLDINHFSEMSDLVSRQF